MVRVIKSPMLAHTRDFIHTHPNYFITAILKHGYRCFNY